jgi:hypothetical protein
MRYQRIQGFFWAMALATVPALAGNIVANPGFETGDFSGWTFTPGAGVSTSGSHSGTHNARFNASVCCDMISQTLATTAGQSYTFSFWLFAGTVGASDQFDALWNGTQIYQDLGHSLGPFYQLLSFTEIASSNATTIAFQGQNTPSVSRLDDVTVQAVPEPCTMVQLCLGSVVLFARRRICRGLKRLSNS